MTQQRRRCAGRRSIASRRPPCGEQSTTRTAGRARLTEGDTAHAAPTALGMVAATRDAERRTDTTARPRHRHLRHYTTSVRGASAHGDDDDVIGGVHKNTVARRFRKHFGAPPGKRGRVNGKIEYYWEGFRVIDGEEA